ncbi:MAG TPA: hypothetical protein VKH42_16120 [Vicinamibacterales bacterium]|nr:hypothetical protein [Vicinamibacterales bacterium]
MSRTLPAAVSLLAAAPAAAQGVSLVPSFTIARIYDDNVFYRPVPESDFATRVSPRVDASYDDGRLRWTGRYQLDADQFDRHPQLSTAHARQDAGVDVSYSATRRLSLSATTAFIESETPLEINLEATPAPGRVRARRLSVQPSATYAVGARTEATMRYTAADDSLADGVGVTTAGASMTVTHHRSPRTDFRFEYSFEHFRFANLDAGSISQAWTAEWQRSLNRATALSLRLGPRVTNGAVSPDVAATVHRQLRAGEAVITYLHTTTTLLGTLALADMHSVSALVAAEPRRGLRIHAGPALLHTTQGPLSSAVYRLTAGCDWPIAKRFVIRGDYDVNVQSGNIYGAQSVETIGRNRLLVSLVATTAAGQAR